MNSLTKEQTSIAFAATIISIYDAGLGGVSRKDIKSAVMQSIDGSSEIEEIVIDFAVMNVVTWLGNEGIIFGESQQYHVMTSKGASCLDTIFGEGNFSNILTRIIFLKMKLGHPSIFSDGSEYCNQVSEKVAKVALDDAMIMKMFFVK